MDKYCAVIGIDSPDIAWEKLEGSDALWIHTYRVSLELDKAYDGGYRQFYTSLDTIMDIYLAMEIIGLKAERPDVSLNVVEPQKPIEHSFTEHQRWMRETITANCNMGIMYGTIHTEQERKFKTIADAGRVIIATAPLYNSATKDVIREYTEICGNREFIEIPLLMGINFFLFLS